MSFAISGEQVSAGRSPEADRIYQQYLQYYQAINEKIHQIDSLPYEQRLSANAQEGRAKLVALQQQLYPMYTYAYNNSNATLASFQNDTASIQTQVEEAFNQAIGKGGNSIHDAIQKKYDEAKHISEALTQQIVQDRNSLNQLFNEQKTLETKIAQLQQEINALPDSDPRKAKAQQDLNQASQALAKLTASIIEAQSQLAQLQTDLDALTGAEGALKHLQDLAGLAKPEQAQLDQADTELKNVKAVQNNEYALQSSLSSANQALNSTNSAVALVQDDLKPLPSIHEKIQENYVNAQNAANTLSQKINENQSAVQQLINQKNDLETTIAQLKQQVNSLSNDDPRKTKAQSDLNAVNEALADLNNKIETASSQLNTLQGMFNALTGTGGTLNQLQQLANKQNPNQADLDQANVLLQNIALAQNYESSTFQASLAAALNQVQSVKNVIHTLQIDLQPANAIEHAAWYIDWTSWDYPVPEGVNTVNLFVGNMHLDNQGNPVIDGFGTLDSAKMTAFVKACHEKGIAVKISLGGGGGSYDKCWDVLTEGNVSQFAKTLADFCHNHGLDGVDFDVEEFSSGQDRPEQQLLAGRFIREFKALDPNFLTSICTNAGFGPGFPWQGVVKNLLDGASTVDPATGEKTCAVERVYIMSYYNSLSQEQAWVSGWADWLRNEYNFENSQITVGLDDKDAHAYDIKEFAAWAARQGFSTGYWEWDPARADESNKSARDIEDSYNDALNGIRLAHIPV